MRVVFVHGACVRDGAWWWRRTAALLEERGVTSVAPALPSCGEAESGAGSVPGLAADAAAVRQAIEATDEPAIVVAHSYGGIVAAQAAAGVDSVRHLLLISSYLPEVGEALADFGGPDGPAPFLEVDADGGTFGVRPELLVETFLQDCDEEDRAQAHEHLAQQRLDVLTQPVTAAAWRDVPSTYLVCAEDRGTPADAQRAFALRAGRVVEVEAGHHPFLSQPAAVADLVLGL